MRRVPILVGLLAVLRLAHPSPVLAQTGNDTYAGRTAVSSSALPFFDVVDTTSATTDADDAEVNCGAPATDASVWYELTADSDSLIHVDVSETVGYVAGVIVATGAPGSFETIACAPRQADFAAVAGQRYAILAFDDQSDGGGNGGQLKIRVSAPGGELLARIRALPGVVSATPAPSTIPGTLFFQISFEQPVDHENSGGPTFLQRLTLLHRSERAPTVLGLDGYYLSATFATQRELTAYLEANQINVEHRFFPPSAPDPRPWPRLTIAQSAADHHRIVQSFKALYTGKWVSTGVSKGGMAAVYHRFFYPADVDATVPYVAPSSHGTRDPRYVRFVGRVGAPECREKLLAFQRAVLARRGEILPLLPPLGFEILGAERALEFAVVETPFAFWQYNRFNSCDTIPTPDASAADLFAFANVVNSPLFFADDDLNAYAPYYYQAATELGGPRYDERSLRGLLNYPREDVPATYPPLGVEKDFDASVMPAIEQWVRTSGPRMLFIYGANDPWSASAFDVRAANDAYRFFVTGGDHLSNIHDLPAAKRIFALRKLKQWLGAAGLDAARLGADDAAAPFDPPTKRELFLR